MWLGYKVDIWKAGQGEWYPKMLWVQITKGLVSHAKEGGFCPVGHGEPVKTQAGQ